MANKRANDIAYNIHRRDEFISNYGMGKEAIGQAKSMRDACQRLSNAKADFYFWSAVVDYLENQRVKNESLQD